MYNYFSYPFQTEFCNLRKELEEKPNDPELINKLIQNIIRFIRSILYVVLDLQG